MAEPSSYLKLIKTLFKSKYYQPLYNKDKKIVTKSSQIINEADPTKINFDKKNQVDPSKAPFLTLSYSSKKKYGKREYKLANQEI